MTNQKRRLGVAILLTVSGLGACSKQAAAPARASETDSNSVGMAAASAAAPTNPVGQKPGVTNRKIIRQAELELQVEAPGTTQTAVERLAEQHGGYVVSSTRNTENGSAVAISVSVTVRVPQAELMSTIAELKHFGRGVGSERIESDDVTDEYVDLAARSASQKQLEQQYLDILKRAANVKDAMEVQRALAEVRTEIERMEGRARLLEKESAFSTLTVQLTTAVPQIAVSGSDFSGSIRRAWSDALSLGSDMISVGIRALGLLLPLVVLLGLPLSLLAWCIRRLGRRKKATILAALAE